MRNDVDLIINSIIRDIDPYNNTANKVKDIKLSNGKNILISIGKAAWSMAKAVCDNVCVDGGIVITKYLHNFGNLKNVEIFEAGHPITDDNGIKASKKAIEMCGSLSFDDNVIMCISGGGSALFEDPLISLQELQSINNQLIKSGASINEINTIRKRLSKVKGGRFAKIVSPAKIYAFVLSDVIGNDVGTIASGPISIDNTSYSDVEKVIKKYNIDICNETLTVLKEGLPNNIDNVNYRIIGSIEQLCLSAKKRCEGLGYKSTIVRNDCADDIEEVARELTSYAKENGKNAFIIGGECSIKVHGNGLGGRNTHLALLCSKYIAGMDNVCVFTFGSDGTDGPTDAAGGYVNGKTYKRIDVDKYLEKDDSYNALNIIDGLIKTGPTLSNLNDIYVLLKR